MKNRGKYSNWAVLFVLLMPAVYVNAASWTAAGNYDTSWYDDMSATFTISTARQLAGLPYLCNSGTAFGGKTIVISSDIDLKGNDWTPISGFAGTVDGRGHTISNLKMTVNGSHAGYIGGTYTSGMFIQLNSSGVIKDMCLTYSIAVSYAGHVDYYAAGLCAVNYGSIDRCTVHGTVSVYRYGGAITASSEGTVTSGYYSSSCTVDAGSVVKEGTMLSESQI